MSQSPRLRRLAQLIANTAAAPEILELAKALIVDAQTPQSPKPLSAPTAASPSGRLGCWQQIPATPLVYERQKDPEGNWHTWADKTHIEVNPNRRQVVLIGESAARGFLYDPYLTVAEALQERLNIAMPDYTQLIDLARTNLSFTECMALVDEAATNLKPDAIVVFAGNNWLSAGDIYGYVDLYALAETLRDEGFSGFVACLQTALEQMASRLVEKLISYKEAFGTRIVLVLPEFNLLDWKPGFVDAPPFLSGYASGEWHALAERAAAALTALDLPTLSDVVNQMLDIDKGFAAHSLWLKAQAVLHDSGPRQARSWLERARDMAAMLPVPQAPSIHSATLKALRDGAARTGIATVDLPRLFGDEGELPNRTHFLDYCHLSAEGIALLAEHTTRALANAFGREETASERLRVARPTAPALTPSSSASAMFLAALHNANWGQSSTIVSYWVNRALQTSPIDAGNWFRAYLEIESCRQPRWTHRLFDQLDFAQAQRYMGFKLNPHLADRILKQAIVDSLDAHDPETRTAQQWQRVLLEEYRPGSDVQDLLEPQHAASHHASLRPFHENPAYFQAVVPSNEFLFVAHADTDLFIKLVARTPHETPDTRYGSIEVNGQHLTNIGFSTQWRRDTLSIPQQRLRQGLNTLTLRWPTVTGTDTTLVERAAARVSTLRGPEVFHIHGQIHSLVVQVGNAATAEMDNVQ